jgi:hypothetical protein
MPASDGRSDLNQPPSAALATVRRFADQLEHAGRHLLSDSSLAGELSRIAENLRYQAQRLVTRGESSIPTIAVLGKTAEGKGWLARCFLLDHPDNHLVRQSIPSGQNDTERSTRLVWFGPESPLGLEEGEHYLQVPASRMLDLGHPYIVGDTPGYSDDSSRTRQLSQIAVSSAAVKIIVLSEEILRDGSLSKFMRKMPGAVVLPVVRFRPSQPGREDPEPARREDIQRYVEQWRHDAPETNILDPCCLPDAAIFSPDLGQTVQLVQRRLRERLLPYVQGTQLRREAVEQQIEAQGQVARRDAAQRLIEFRRRVGPCVHAIENIRQELPQRLVRELLGSDLQLRAAVRRRFQAMWMDLTPGWCFPYRSFLGLLVLTSGAWDRLILSLAGSLPSLALTVAHSLTNLRDAQTRQAQVRAGVAQRLEQLAQDELRAEVKNFERSLEALLTWEEGPSPQSIESWSERSSSNEGVIHVEGLEEFEGRCREIMEHESQRYAPPAWLPRSAAILATCLFALLVSGPLVAVYREYLTTTWSVLTSAERSWSDFPVASASMMFTALLLSAAPVFGMALLALGWGCRASRVQRSIETLRGQHDAAIHEWTRNRLLDFRLNDPRLEMARFLLQIAESRQGGDGGKSSDPGNH